MHYYIITGTSRGIGLALATDILQSSQNHVYGLSRTTNIEHRHFEFCKLDLTDRTAVEKWPFPAFKDAESITLINNSGALGHVAHVGKLNEKETKAGWEVNLIAPSTLMNSFVNKYEKYTCAKTILNISSGAARHAIESWSQYCAAKAGLDMFSQVLNVEQKRHAAFPVRVFSVAPGIVDTQMQTEIRGVHSSNFSEVQRFKDYKEQGQLSDPKDVATQLLKLIQNRDSQTEVILDIRNL